MTQSSYSVISDPSHLPIKSWTHGVQVEEKAIQQLKNVASLPFIFKHLAVMPDVHWGMGATVGSVIATKGAIIPAAVGVDLGCGMNALKTNLTANDLPNNLHNLRSRIESQIPHGRTDNGGLNDRGAWGEAKSLPKEIDYGLTNIVLKHEKLYRAANRAPNHLGTLGTGNHFIELCLDENNSVWIMLHSGSRGIGNAIGSYFIDLAKKDMKKYFINLPDADLAYIPEGSENFDDYLTAVSWAQDFALANRNHMMNNVLTAISTELETDSIGTQEIISCHHNYVTRENHFNTNVIITRKGAVRARTTDLGIIPGSMGTKSYIVRGKGNPESFSSCSHGAGRRMSRNEAKKTFTLEDHNSATLGVECRKDLDVIDETPGAYKNIDQVMLAQEDLVEIVHTLKQILCVKG